MSKYIRTIDEIYELNNDVYVENNEAFMRWFNGSGKEIEPTCLGKVIKQSDTIEELCDEFVVAFEENNDKITYIDLDWARDKAKRYAGHTTIYGAVWCEWGLKYVAKLNENGELVLI